MLPLGAQCLPMLVQKGNKAVDYYKSQAETKVSKKVPACKAEAKSVIHMCTMWVKDSITLSYKGQAFWFRYTG